MEIIRHGRRQAHLCMEKAVDSSHGAVTILVKPAGKAIVSGHYDALTLYLSDESHWKNLNGNVSSY